jgi:6-phosphogluconolactonase (cycloisomerase 2 family)
MLSSTRTRVIVSLAVVALVALAAGFLLNTFSSFTSVTSNAANTGAAGTVAVGDNDSGTAMLTMTGLKPGDTDTGCIRVTSTGTLPSVVRLYGTTGGSGLADHLSLVVTRGSGAAGFDACTGFTADTTDYAGSGAGVIYSGTLQGFPDNYAAGAQDPKATSPESWTTGEAHTYRFALTVADTNAAQGLTYTQTFTWEGRNQAAGELSEVFGTGGCVSDDGSGGACADGTALDRVRDVAVSPDGAHAYAGVENSDAILIFSRNTTTGVLTQLGGTAGCISEDGSGGACTDGKALDAVSQVTLSPDGAHLYATAAQSDAVAVFTRNSGTGALTQLAGTAGCVSEDGTGGACTDGKGLDDVVDVIVSPNGASLYTVAQTGDVVAIFSRNSGTGALTQLAGTAGCISDDGSGGACADGTGLDGAHGVAVSPDGNNVYTTAASTSDTLAIFSRNSGTGALTQLAGTAGCISDTGSGGACADGNTMDNPTSVIVSPDGRNVYATASGTSDAMLSFSRNSGSGALTQLGGTAGCISDTGSGGACTDGSALDGSYGSVISADGKTVHAVAVNSDAVVSFARSSSNGQLTQLAGTAGCISDDGSSGACADGTALDGPIDLDMSPDGASIYAAISNTDAVVNLARAR